MKSYLPAERAIVAHLVKGDALPSSIEPPFCQEAIDAFSNAEWPTDGMSFRYPNTKQEKLLIEDVEVSLVPSFIVQNSRGETGACKLILNKPEADGEPQIDESIGRRMSTLLYYYGSVFEDNKSYSASLCNVWCVRDGEVIDGTHRYKKMLDDISAACREISTLWDSI